MTIECPKCYGHQFPQHADIFDGLCFLCRGAGKVSPKAASQWLAGQADLGNAPVVLPAAVKVERTFTFGGKTETVTVSWYSTQGRGHFTAFGVTFDVCRVAGILDVQTVDATRADYDMVQEVTRQIVAQAAAKAA